MARKGSAGSKLVEPERLLTRACGLALRVSARLVLQSEESSQRAEGRTQQKLRQELATLEPEIGIALASARQRTDKAVDRESADRPETLTWTNLGQSVDNAKQRLGARVRFDGAVSRRPGIRTAFQTLALLNSVVDGIGDVPGLIHRSPTELKQHNLNVVAQYARAILKNEDWLPIALATLPEIERRVALALLDAPDGFETLHNLGRALSAGRVSMSLMANVLSWRGGVPVSQDPIVWRAWSYVRLVKAAMEEVGTLAADFDICLPTPSGDLQVIASSRQSMPVSPTDPFDLAMVVRGRLTAGATLLTGSPIINHSPSSVTSTSPVLDGEISCLVAAPVATTEATFGAVISRAAKCAIDGEDLGDLSPNHCLAFLLAEQVGSDFSKRSPDVPWYAYCTPPLPAEAVEEKLRQIVEQAVSASARRTALVVVSAQPVDDSNGCAALLSSWGRLFSLKAAHIHGAPVYSGPVDGSYLFVVGDLSHKDWRDMRDLLTLEGRARVATVSRPDTGVAAGRLGIWIVGWEDVALANARDCLGMQSTVAMVEHQLTIAASNVVKLNRIQDDYRRGDAAQALVDALDIAARFDGACGVAVSDVIRLLLHRHDSQRALTWAVSRLWKAGGWELNSHVNFLLAATAAAKWRDAVEHIDDCPTCTKAKEAGPDDIDKEPFATPLLSLAVALLSVPRTPLEKQRVELRLRNALRVLADDPEPAMNLVEEFHRAVTASTFDRMVQVADQANALVRVLEDEERRKSEATRRIGWHERAMLRLVATVIGDAAHAALRLLLIQGMQPQIPTGWQDSFSPNDESPQRLIGDPVSRN